MAVPPDTPPVLPGAAGEHFAVCFHLGGNWPDNPYRFQGRGQIVVEPDFLTVRGSSHRSFRLPKRETHRVRMVDIVNVRVEGEDVLFDVVGVNDTVELGFSAADNATARAIAALLPKRMTEEFRIAYAEREVFHDRIDYWSPSTPLLWVLFALNVGIYLLMWWQRQTPVMPALASFLGWGSAMDAGVRPHQLVAWGSNLPRLTAGDGQWWRLVSSMFLHGNLLHLLFNMFALWQVGGLVERIFGSARFAGLYLLAGISGSLSSLLWGVLTQSPVNSVGASGAIFGIIGGLLAFIGRENSGVPPTVVANMRSGLAPFLIFNIVAGFAYPHTDNAAHIGGLAGGWLAGHLLARSLHVPGQSRS